jgi:hypothetical protein
VPNKDLLDSIDKVIDYATALKTEAKLIKTFDCISDKQLLYEQVLKCDRELKSLKVLKAHDVLHAVVNKKIESTLN